MDQSNRYADLGMNEKELIAQGQHVLVAYIMKPKAGFGLKPNATANCHPARETRRAM